jgi:riboflavin kinase/FMN adenylyltransferase
VVHGHEVGRQLGFPTANLEAIDNGQWTMDNGQVGKMLPANGAYAVVGGMLNIGTRPTIGNGSDVSVEVNLFDICDNLYGQTLTLSFIARLREERRFESEEDLISQLQHDKQLALSLQP